MRYGQIVHDLLSQNGHIEFNPVVGTLDDLTSGNTNPYWIRSDGGVYTDVYQMKDPEYVRASLTMSFGMVVHEHKVFRWMASCVGCYIQHWF